MPSHKTVIQALEATSSTYGSLAAMRHKKGGNWETLTWNEYRDQVGRVAKGLMALGVDAGNGAVILADNGPRWFAAHFGTIAAGAIPAGIYTNSTPEQCHFIAEHAEAVVAFVDNAASLDKILGIRHRLPRVWEKIQVVIEAAGTQSSGLEKAAALWTGRPMGVHQGSPAVGARPLSRGLFRRGTAIAPVWPVGRYRGQSS